MEDVTLDVGYLERMLECHVCLEQFSDPEKKPKMLPCQHTVCGRCVVVLAAETGGAIVRCPDCRTAHIVPLEGPHSFPNNISIMGFMALSLKTTCKESDCNERDCCSRCFHCDKKICAKHLRQHTKEVQEQIQNKAGDIKHYVTRYRAMITEVQKLSAKCEQDAREMKGKVAAVMDNLIAQLVEKRIELLKDVDHKTAKALDIYFQQKTELKKKAAAIDQYCDTLNDILATDVITSAVRVEEVQSQCQAYKDTASEETAALKTQRYEFDFNLPNIFQNINVGNISEKVHQISVVLDEMPTPTPRNKPETECDYLMNKEMYIKKGDCLMNMRQVTVGQRQVNWVPRGVALCPSTGDVIITSGIEPFIYVLDYQLHHLNSFGKRGNKPGELNNPCGVTVNTQQEIVVCDRDNARLQVLTKAGEAIRVVEWPEEMRHPSDVALDEDGFMYVAAYWNDNVLMFDATGQPLTKILSPGSAPGEFNFPASKAVSGSCVAVSERGSRRLQLFDRAGTLLHSVSEGEGALSYPRGVCADNCGNIVVVDESDGCVKVYTTQGQFLCKFYMLDFERSQCYNILSCIAVTVDGRLLVTNSVSKSLLVY